MDTQQAEFIYISHFAGMREDLVQAGGGNSSVKISSQEMLIKSSGVQLADITEDSGFSKVDYKGINKFFATASEERISKSAEGKLIKTFNVEGGKPSIETFLHAMTKKYTLHTHPTVVTALTSRNNGCTKVKELFPDSLFVPYATPGIALAKKMFSLMKASTSDNKIIFLENHGLIVSSDNPQDIVPITEYVTKKIEAVFGIDHSQYYGATSLYESLRALQLTDIVWTVTDLNIMSSFHKLRGDWNHAFCPDSVVFLGKRILFLEDEYSADEIKKFIDQDGKPVVISHKDSLYICAKTVKKALEIQSVLSFAAQVQILNRGEDTAYLSEEEQHYLLNWEAENYRQQI